MFYALNWFLSLALLALLSLACWGMHAVTVWVVSSAGALASGSAVANAILVPGWLKAWMPPELMGQWEAFVSSVGPMVQAVLEAVPALAGGVTFLAWVLWGLGAVLLVALAVGIHILIALAKRHNGGPGAAKAALVR
ncbi:hypothetical protein EXV95_02760 [Acidovorax sp. JMULE5]|uniref:hypothetical protein n=1 Tax=Acidovorax sp. JMULE5 TaxID=2518343 RepID=UPI00159FC802|nr:hypothetical protein [Acidovorax sp. JMULE5]QLA79670.1 hypothetical protein EXV95_02760 [Acidovorax sp. JMULE5]